MLAGHREFGLSLEDAGNVFRQYHERFPAVQRCKEVFWEAVRRREDYSWKNGFGRIYRERRLSSATDTPRRRQTRARAERESFSRLIQGTAADLVRMAMVRVADVIQEGTMGGRWTAHMVLQVHDEIQIDAPATDAGVLVPAVRSAMEAFSQFSPIPIEIDIEYTDQTWAEKRRAPWT